VAVAGGPAELVGDPEELGGEGVLGPEVDVLRAPPLHDVAAVHQDDGVGDREGLLLVVGDVDGGDPDGLLEPPHLDAEPLAHLGVEVRQGLVHQEDAGLDHQRPGHRHALLLAPGEGRGLPVHDPFQVPDLDERQHLLHPGPHLGVGDLPQPQAVGHVVEDGHVGPERVVLEHHGRAARLRRQPCDVLGAEEDPAAVRRDEPRDAAEQRGLPAAGRPQDRRQPAAREVDVDPAERGDPAVALGQPLDPDVHQIFGGVSEDPPDAPPRVAAAKPPLGRRPMNRTAPPLGDR
jgi:hypothetical protein